MVEPVRALGRYGLISGTGKNLPRRSALPHPATGPSRRMDRTDNGPQGKRWFSPRRFIIDLKVMPLRNIFSPQTVLNLPLAIALCCDDVLNCRGKQERKNP
jgi:hypothetical protein